MESVMFLTVRNNEGALERLLRVTRHRGFAVQSLQVQNSRSQDIYDVTLRLTGERATENLSRQLGKLVDVMSVNAVAEPMLLRSAV
ncbi:acetolactate synthase 2 small subunit [Permianibacter aggregans]|uniref:Acetolactate synthase small subunit n=1 Tax=Permianibacter aggregans TaxID=1510150 RepID=A0A4R6UKP3_9GAMM|nr:acetolactate synthase 2 small subunit [Permianibacter aggregans]QGX39250.1 acetolactate synthase 2 small subunit [Permianibacter aggregans]TDQ46059.1 acetolactate synthase small subunit [Permianibacter aggregans]